MPPTLPPISRVYLDPVTGQEWTLSYSRGSLGHTVRLDPPFGVPVSRVSHNTPDVGHARRMWRLIEGNIVRQHGLVVA